MLAIVVNRKKVAVQRHFLKRGELRHSSELLSQFFTLIRFKPIFLDDVTSAMQNSDEKKPIQNQPIDFFDLEIKRGSFL